MNIGRKLKFVFSPSSYADFSTISLITKCMQREIKATAFLTNINLPPLMKLAFVPGWNSFFYIYFHSWWKYSLTVDFFPTSRNLPSRNVIAIFKRCVSCCFITFHEMEKTVLIEWHWFCNLMWWQLWLWVFPASRLEADIILNSNVNCPRLLQHQIPFLTEIFQIN